VADDITGGTTMTSNVGCCNNHNYMEARTLYELW
jgi:hypothetical protein